MSRRETGSLDKNGTKVFEGDTILYSSRDFNEDRKESWNNVPAIVTWDENRKIFYGKRPGYAMGMHMDWIAKFGTIKQEVTNEQ
jgi:hypothetical protein